MNPFLGEIRLFTGIFAPVGWNYCDGTILSIATNDALYALIGTTYGGDGVNTFALPDLRGRVPVHIGPFSGGQYSMGEFGGVENVTLLSASIPPHTHPLVCTANKGNAVDPTGNVIAQVVPPPPPAPQDDCKLFVVRPASVAYNAAHVGPSPGGTPHENRQPYVACNYIIATAGIFPSQG